MNPRETRLLVAVAALLLGWFFVGVVARPALQNQADWKQKIQAKSLQLRKTRQAISQRDVLEKAFETLGSFDKVSRGDINAMSTELMQTLESIKREVGLQIEKTAPQDPEIMAPFVRIQVNIEVEDRIESIIGFILKLRESPKQISLLNLRIVASHQKERTLRASFTVAQLALLDEKGTVA